MHPAAAEMYKRLNKQARHRDPNRINMIYNEIEREASKAYSHSARDRKFFSGVSIGPNGEIIR